MANYHVVAVDNGWKIVGAKTGNIFRTKKNATMMAKKFARSENKSVVLHSKEGKVIEVISYDTELSSGKLLSANVKHRLSRENVRNSIAEVISERTGIKQ